MRKAKRTLIKLHRVTGSVLSLMFFIWSISGIILIFNGFPHASREERFLHLDTFNAHDFVNIKSLPDSIKGTGISLEKYQGKMVYRVPVGKRGEKVYDASAIQQIGSFSELECRTKAESFTGFRTLQIEKIAALDQWLPWSRYTPLLPIYKFYMDDSFHTVIYVSSKSGSIIQQTDRKGRWFARMGVIPHWVYFKTIKLNDSLWKNIIIWLSIIGLFVCITGLASGFIRLRKRKHWKEKGISRYKKFWFKWHHIIGLIFGIFLFTFLLSGLFSVVKFGDAKGRKSLIKSWDKGNSKSRNSIYNPKQLWNSLDSKVKVRKLEIGNSMGEPAWMVYRDDYQVPEVYLIREDTLIRRFQVGEKEIKDRVRKIYKQGEIAIDLQHDYDNYYQKSGMHYRPLPVYRLWWNDAPGSCLYVDPVSGMAVTFYDRNTRIHKLLYQGLHKLNFQYLKEHEWLRKSMLFLLSIAVLIISFTGVVLGWKWMIRRLNSMMKQ